MVQHPTVTLTQSEYCSRANETALRCPRWAGGHYRGLTLRLVPSDLLMANMDAQLPLIESCVTETMISV